MRDISIGIMSLISLCFSVEMSQGNDSDGPVFRIVNGKVAKLGQFPYQVAMRVKVKPTEPYLTFCGGAILRKHKVLTAAHCAVDGKVTAFEKMCCTRYKKRKNMYAVAATLESLAAGPPVIGRSTEQWRKVSDIAVPRGYEFPKNDIAIVITKTPFEFNNNVGSLPAAIKRMDYGKMSCVASGYGKLSKGVRSAALMWAYLDLIPKSECSRIHRQPMNRFVCTRSDVTDVLQGDSGGPLVCKNTGDPADLGKGVIVGVVSGARMGAGTFFTRVTSFNEFIDSKAVTAELPFASIVFFTGLLRWLHGHG